MYPTITKEKSNKLSYPFDKYTKLNRKFGSTDIYAATQDNLGPSSLIKSDVKINFLTIKYYLQEKVFTYKVLNKLKASLNISIINTYNKRNAKKNDYASSLVAEQFSLAKIISKAVVKAKNESSAFIVVFLRCTTCKDGVYFIHLEKSSNSTKINRLNLISVGNYYAGKKKRQYEHAIAQDLVHVIDGSKINFYSIFETTNEHDKGLLLVLSSYKIIELFLKRENINKYSLAKIQSDTEFLPGSYKLLKKLIQLRADILQFNVSEDAGEIISHEIPSVKISKSFYRLNLTDVNARFKEVYAASQVLNSKEKVKEIATMILKYASTGIILSSIILLVINKYFKLIALYMAVYLVYKYLSYLFAKSSMPVNISSYNKTFDKEVLTSSAGKDKQRNKAFNKYLELPTKSVDRFSEKLFNKKTKKNTNGISETIMIAKQKK